MVLGYMNWTDNKNPVQCVLRPHSSSTKVRVAFDASSPDLSCSLTIRNSFLRFWVHAWDVTADIAKLSCQIELNTVRNNTVLSSSMLEISQQ